MQVALQVRAEASDTADITGGYALPMWVLGIQLESLEGHQGFFTAESPSLSFVLFDSLVSF